MSDELKIVEFGYGGRPIEIFNLEQMDMDIAGDVVKVRDSFKFTPGSASNVDTVGPRRWDGSRVVGQKVGNGSVAARWRVSGNTAQDALSNVESLLETVTNAERGRYIKWRPEGASSATYYEIRDPGEWNPDYRFIEFSQLYNVYVDASWPVAPLAELDRMDIFDDFMIPNDAVPLFVNEIQNPSHEVVVGGNNCSSSSAGLTASVVSRSSTWAKTGIWSQRYQVNRNDAGSVALAAGRSPLGLNGIPVVPGEMVGGRIAGVRQNTKVWASCKARIYWYQSDGTASVTSVTDGPATNNPAMGAVNDMFVAAVVPVDAAFAAIAFVVTVNPTGLDTQYLVDTDAYMIVRGLPVTIPTGVNSLSSNIPEYFDGNSDRAIWNGTAHSSASTLYDRGSLDDWTWDLAIGTLAAGSGCLIPTTLAQKRLVHIARGHRYDDIEATLRVLTGSTVNTVPSVHRITLKTFAVDMDNYLYVQMSGTNSFTIGKRDNGVLTTLATGSSLGRVANKNYWLRGRTEGNTVIAEVFTSQPSPMLNPAFTLTYTLSGSDAAKFGIGAEGYVGLEITPDILEERYYDFTVEPLTYRRRTLPELSKLASVPGSPNASALLNFKITQSTAGGAAPIWGLIGWWRKPVACNYVWNGDIEDNTVGWAGSGGLVSGTSTLSRVTTSSRYGAASLQVVTPATANAGCNFRVYGKFRAGIPYTAEAWIAGSGNSVQVGLGIAGDNQIGTAAALQSAYQRIEVTWVPAVDRNFLDVAVRQVSASVTTFTADAVSVYEGTTAPTIVTQQEGRGAIPPLGIIPASAAYSTTMTAITDTNYRHGSGLRTTTSGAGSAVASFYIDPSLVAAEDFTANELDVELWARIEVAATVVTPRIVVSTRSEDGGVTYGPPRYTADFGSAGKSIVTPSSGTVFRPIRLGTLTIYANSNDPARWTLRIDVSWSAGSTGNFGIDQIYAVPLDSRAVSGPTGRIFDATYPAFLQTFNETIKTIRFDGSAVAQKPGSGQFLDVGMSRTLELFSGESETLVLLSTLVPDDPTSNATTEQKDHFATVHYGLIPRVQFARS